MSKYEYRIRLVHDSGCHSCNTPDSFDGRAVFDVLLLYYCATCEKRLDDKQVHVVDSKIYCDFHADAKADDLAMVVSERRLVGDWEPFEGKWPKRD